MALLSTRDAALIAADMTEVWPDSAQILRASNTTDGLGGRNQSWTVHATTVCRLSPYMTSSGAEEAEGGAVRNEQAYKLAVPVGTDILITDRVSTNGLTLAVQQLYTPRSVELERVAVVERCAA